MIDANARMGQILLRMNTLELDALRADYQMRLAIAEIEQLFNQARRLQLEQEEAQQLSINVQAARNDPNRRVYRNDAIVNAEFSFEQALREVYRLTLIYEYYTSTTYAFRDQLFLIRMVQYGDYNLENYLAQLENAFIEWEEQFGVADTRVSVISLRDDIMNIPTLDDEARAMTQTERIEEMRVRLADPALLDENGYITIPFSTSFEELSPLTRNHKIQWIEAELIGSDVGDTVGRIYLRQQGTSVVNGTDGTRRYYRFDDRMAVINPFFNGNRIFDQSVYRNYRLRDTPYVNTSWELVINQRDELANQDVNLQSLTDIRLYVYYEDFTALGDEAP